MAYLRSLLVIASVALQAKAFDISLARQSVCGSAPTQISIGAAYVFMTPNFPFAYSPTTSCSWSYTSAPGGTLAVYCAGSVPCTDSFSIASTPGTNRTFCGVSSIAISAGPAVNITLKPSSTSAGGVSICLVMAQATPSTPMALTTPATTTKLPLTTPPRTTPPRTTPPPPTTPPKTTPPPPTTPPRTTRPPPTTPPRTTPPPPSTPPRTTRPPPTTPPRTTPPPPTTPPRTTRPPPTTQPPPTTPPRTTPPPPTTPPRATPPPPTAPPKTTPPPPTTPPKTTPPAPTTPPVSTPKPTVTSTVKPSSNCSCGIQGPAPNRIVGGSPAGQTQFPWMVMLLEDYYGPFCGGSIIAPGWVLTAAHCTNGFDLATSRLTTVAGRYSISTSSTTEQFSDVVQIFQHPSYNPTTYDNDLSLLKLQTDFTFSPAVSPICLPLPFAAFDFANQTGVASGWGTTSSGGTQSMDLLQVTLPILSSSQCRQYSAMATAVTNNMICTYQAGKDTCQGDSGGPLGWVDPVSKRTFLAGVTSWGIGCAGVDLPGAYAKVNNYLSWIQTTTGQTFCSP